MIPHKSAMVIYPHPWQIFLDMCLQSDLWSYRTFSYNIEVCNHEELTKT